MSVTTGPAPEEGALTIDNAQQLISIALRKAGIVGYDEAIEQIVLNDAFSDANDLLALWARKRWLVYRLAEYSFITTGAQTYPVGRKQTVDINPRPDRLEYAFLRFLPQPGGGASPGPFNVDIPVKVIQSRENYAQIPVKNIGTIAWRMFYDPVWPVGTLYPWPVPQASLYELHVGFKTVLPRFTSLTDKINFPPEYEVALKWNLARFLRASYQLPADPDTNAIAKDALNAMRLANQAMPVLQMPSFLKRRGGRAYDFRGDSDSYT